MNSNQLVGVKPQLTQHHGWGLYAYHLTRRLLERGMTPVLFCEAPPDLGPEAAAAVQAAISHYHQAILPVLAQMSAQNKTMSAPFPVLHALFNDFALSPSVIDIGPQDVGSIFFESRGFTPEGLERARRFRRIIAGSHWNAEVLRSLGLPDVAMCHQGVDGRVFYPGPRGDRFGADRFVVFSGGQLHLRKGQDIVIAAFAAFHRRHPDSLLVSAWHSPWPATAASLTRSPHLKSVPALRNDRLNLVPWVVEQGLPADAFIDLGVVPNHALGDLLRSTDAAVFPNRGEGGTNLLAMECLATGLPTILADNTGQRDLVAAFDAYPLRRQAAVDPTLSKWDMSDWGESSVEEVTALLEDIYTRRDEARTRGQACATAMRDWDWSAKADAIIDAIIAS
ncbi:glycosyltransferase family 4 protein [Telmatospirillum siberiense]|uniref:glycosyltransferase family 4 protein n=1 Tax=Telmatospirillum siberiense TaxID=382514 RepID=UPI001303F813|nr:glycosyltransferase family 4 protein [Telmatospirillum siberiense]